ncbi:hypothetical protein HCJ53_06510 [Listeria welshimeri]|nr:hypothetical protein [Listeria welshimeri]
MINGYNCANNNPVMYVDPDGNFPLAISVFYRGYSIAIAAAQFIGYGIGKAGSWASGKTEKSI